MVLLVDDESAWLTTSRICPSTCSRSHSDQRLRPIIVNWLEKFYVNVANVMGSVVAGPVVATENARSASVDWRLDGTIRPGVAADLSGEREKSASYGDAAYVWTTVCVRQRDGTWFFSGFYYVQWRACTCHRTLGTWASGSNYDHLTFLPHAVHCGTFSSCEHLFAGFMYPRKTSNLFIHSFIHSF